MMSDLKSNPTFFSGINSKSDPNISEKLEDFVKLINTNNIPFKFEQNNNNTNNIPFKFEQNNNNTNNMPFKFEQNNNNTNNIPFKFEQNNNNIESNIEIQSSNDKELLEL